MSACRLPHLCVHCSNVLVSALTKQGQGPLENARPDQIAIMQKVMQQMGGCMNTGEVEMLKRVFAAQAAVEGNHSVLAGAV